ncbi:hypothetical protein Tsubulata_015225 [Turnera subulata]|uniref:DUF4283 domain-containing protein n=1 Tax=Turnera subulata TaxID=218843 RepID=A0A9Q0FIP9_9ROSI|nr:hypothetical protein Tsubulata_015225 [Turnera subulata]
MASFSSRRIIDLGGGNSNVREVTPEESLGAIVARTYVVEKILGDRRPHISQMLNAWYIKGDLRIIPKPNNIFLIAFELEEDKKKVLKGSPWLVSNMHFCLKGWFPTEPTMLGWQGFIRARIEVESEMPLLSGVMCLDQNGKEFWVRFQHERLGKLYCHCGKITHPRSRCLKPSRSGGRIERQAKDSFGLWMHAKEMLSKHYPARKQIPLEVQEKTMVLDQHQNQGGTQGEEATVGDNLDLQTTFVMKNGRSWMSQ